MFEKDRAKNGIMGRTKGTKQIYFAVVKCVWYSCIEARVCFCYLVSDFTKPCRLSHIQCSQSLDEPLPEGMLLIKPLVVDVNGFI